MVYATWQYLSLFNDAGVVDPVDPEVLDEAEFPVPVSLLFGYVAQGCWMDAGAQVLFGGSRIFEEEREARIELLLQQGV